MNLPAQHRWVETEDGSKTLFSEAFQEACHSTSGARAETQLHYLEGCEIERKLLAHDHTSILEVGFGRGLGFEMTRELVNKLQRPCTFISLEIDANLVEWYFSQHPMKETEHFKFHIVTGNARKALPEFLKKNPLRFDAIYQDAFSPKRNPVLWTKEWFTLLKENSSNEVILSTYSASNSIRKSLAETGWTIQKGEKFGPKRTSTRARLQGSTDADIMEQLHRSPVKALADADLPQELFQ